MFWLGLGIGIVVAALAALLIAHAHTKPRSASTGQPPDSAHLAKLGAMTAGLAHEIRNPLSTIGLNAQLLSELVEDLPIDDAHIEPLTKRIGTLRREIDRLTGILEDFLRYAGQIQLSPIETDLITLVQELADFFLPQANRHNVKIALEHPDQPLIAYVDPSYLKQALLNLLLNAIQAMDVQDHSDSQQTLTIALRSLDAEHAVRIDVSDTGPGMPPETLEQIFTPYFSTRPTGAGLGLPITKRIIDAHQGTIDVTSTPDQGTTFSITVPTQAPPLDSTSA